MTFCPFMSNAAQRVFCSEDCALCINKKCAFVITANSSKDSAYYQELTAKLLTQLKQKPTKV